MIVAYPALELFPWKKAELEAGELYEFSWRYELPLSVDELWPYLIDSSRLNKAVGYDGIVYSEESGLLHGARGEGKLREEWVEYPFEWTKPSYVHRMRKYSKGYITYNKTIFYSEETPTGSALTVYIGSVSPHPLARKLVPGFMKPFEERYRAAFAKVIQAAEIQKSAEVIFDLTRLQLSEDKLRLLDNLLGKIPDGENTALRRKLRDFILLAELDTLSKVRPLTVAHAWEAGEDEVVSLFLRAAHAGIFSLTWNTVCPHCRGERDSLPSLGAVPVNSKCAVCDIDFAIGGENSVEVNFRLTSQIAELPRVMYCSAEPSRKAHIFAQRLVDPGAMDILVAADTENARVRYQTAIQYRPADTTGKVDWRLDGKGKTATLHIENRAATGVQVIYEDVLWDRDILTPARVFRLQEFRDLFSEEHLSTELQLDVGQQTIMFTDLVGSTRFYEEAGDAQAFGTLRRYFQTIYHEARRENGAIVKTIGDGAMLVFADPAGAMRAAIGFLRKFGGGSHQIRVTLNSGKCLAVNLNTGIDYFGRTVNLAAKLQSQCSGQEILCTQEIMTFPGVKSALEKNNLGAKADTFEHPAFASKIPVSRIS